MKNIFFLLFSILCSQQLIFSQGSNNLKDIEMLQRLKFNQIFNSSYSSLSSVETVNGFDNFRLGTDFAETMIATNPGNPLNSICAFNRNNLYYTLNGVDWNKVMSNFPVVSDPSVCFDSLGNGYFTEISPSYNSITLFKTTNSGLNWTNYNIYTGSPDKPSIIAVQNNGPFGNYLYCTWSNTANPTGIYVSRSTNGGTIWSSPVRVNVNDSNYLPWIAVGPNGNTPGGSLYCSYIPTMLDSCKVHIRRSTDGGLTFQQEIIAGTFMWAGDSVYRNHMLKNFTVDVDPCTQMAADNSYGPYRGRVYIVCCARRTNNDLADIMFIRSTDYGTTWSNPIKVNDDNTNTDQWMPTLNVDKITGKIFLSWYDSRIDPINNIQTKLFGTVSTDGGLTFSSNTPISTISFNPINIAIGGYLGDYNGISAIGNTSYASWTDGRDNDMGSYAGYYPDFALLVSPYIINIGSNDSMNVVVKLPAVNGPFNDRVKFTATLDTLPQIGNINYYFAGRDSISVIPDSIILKIKTINVNVPRLHRIFVTAHGTYNGVPVHIRTINILVNSSFLTIGTNRNGPYFKVNGTTYDSIQQLHFPNGSNIIVQALSPYLIGNTTRYVYVSWSDFGDTTHSFIINSNLNLTANYKTQFMFNLISFVGNTFGGSNFYDSLLPHTFGVLSRNIIFNGQFYQFRGWDGYGNGSYTSSDSTGNDSIVTVTMYNMISEEARWVSPIGIKPISNNIPKEYRLYQNYPNPFNPSTKIKFDIPNIKPSFTKGGQIYDLVKGGVAIIKIYDILGREVATLINEKLAPGTYEVEWNATNFTSGVYFYKLVVSGAEPLQAGDFVATKKLILLK